MSKNKYKIIGGLIIFLIIFLGYKIFLTYYYKIAANEVIVKQIKEMESINIDFQKEKEYTHNYEKLYFYLNKNYEKKIENNFDNYYLGFIENNKYDSKILIGKHFELNNLISNEEINSKRILENNNINNNQELYNFIIKNFSKSLDVFQSKKEMENIYLSKMLGNAIIIQGKMYKLTGDLNGYLYSVGDGKVFEVHIFKENEQYVIDFWNNNQNNYDLEFVKNFLANIKLD